MKTTTFKALLAAAFTLICTTAHSGSADTWGAWSDLGAATYTHGTYRPVDSEQSFKTTLQIRQCTDAGSENLYQIRVPKAFNGNDLIFLWHRDDNLSTNVIDGESIALDYMLEGEDDLEFQSIAFSDGTYSQAKGVMSFNVWYSLNDINNAVYGYSVRDKIVLDNAQNYFFDVMFGKQCYNRTESTATFTFAHSDNISSVRYYAEPAAYSDFSKPHTSLKEANFINKELSTAAADSPISINMEGYQPYDLYVQALSADNKVVAYTSVMVFSTQDDNRTWRSLGNGTLRDNDIKAAFDNSDGYTSWPVEVQQCTDDETLYRLVNPYTCDACPYRNMVLTDDYAELYTLDYDTAQNYYILFRADALTAGSDATSYCYPTGIALTEKATGEQYACFTYNFTTLADDYLVSNADASVQFAFPQYTDYAFTLTSDDGNTVTINASTDSATYVYQIASTDGKYMSEAKDVTGTQIDLSAEEVEGVGDFTLTVYSHSPAGDVKDTEVYPFTVGVTDWQYVGRGTATYAAYTSGNESLYIYKRHETTNPAHEQYQLRKWMYGSCNLLIDMADNNTYDSTGHIVVTVPKNNTDYVYGSYGNVQITDVYTYLENDNYYNDSYFIPALGEFHLNNVYYVEKGYLGFDYEVFKIDGYPDLTLIDKGKSAVDGINTQTIEVSISNVAYVKYGVFNADLYTAGIAAAELGKDADAARLTDTTILTFNNEGNNLLVAIAYDSDDNIIETESMHFILLKAVDLSQWSYVGKSTLVDGWLTPLYSFDGETLSAADNPWQVDTYVSLDNPGIVGLYNPYLADGCPIKDSNSDKTNDVMIAIDLSTDGFVMIKPQNSGFVDATHGMFKIFNNEGMFISSISDIDKLKTALVNNNIALSVKSIGDDGNAVVEIPKGLYSAGGSIYHSAQSSYIILPQDVAALRVVTAEDDDAPTEYYNLQGMRVANPSHGIYILRRGATSRKVLR